MENVLSMTPAQSRKRQWKIPAIWIERLAKEWPQLRMDQWRNTDSWLIKNSFNEACWILTQEDREKMTEAKFNKLAGAHSLSMAICEERTGELLREVEIIKNEIQSALIEDKFLAVRSLGETICTASGRLDRACLALKAMREKAAS
jgi:hypothetical protein